MGTTSHRLSHDRGAGRFGGAGVALAGVAGASALMAPRAASALDFYGHEIPSGDPGVNFVAGLVMGAFTATCVTLAACHAGRGAETAGDAESQGLGGVAAQGNAAEGVGTAGAGVAAGSGMPGEGPSAGTGEPSVGGGTLDVTADLGTLRPRAYARREGGSVYIPDLEELAAAAREARMAGVSGTTDPSAEAVAPVPAEGPAPAGESVPVDPPAPVGSSSPAGPSAAPRRAAHMRTTSAPAASEGSHAGSEPDASFGHHVRHAAPAPSASRRRGRHFAPGALEAFAGASGAEDVGASVAPVIDETMSDAEVSAHIASLVADEMERAREREVTPARRKTVRLPSGSLREHLRVIDGVRVM